MNGHKITLALVPVGLLLAGSALAQVPGVPPGRWWERPRVAEELGITAEQRDKLDTLTVGHAKVMIDLKATVDKAEIDLKAAADAEPLDAARVRAAFAAMQQARGRLEGERFEMLLKVRQTLTAGQWQRLRELGQRLRERRALEGGEGPEGAPPAVRQPRKFQY